MKRLITNNFEPVNRDGLILQLSYRKTGKVATLGSWRDYSGKANNGTLYGNALVNQNGLVCDRTDNCNLKISIGVIPVRTVCFNLKLNSHSTDWYDCLFRDGASYQGFNLQTNAGNLLNYSKTDGNTVQFFGTLSIGSKTALALTTDGSTMSFYKDGAQIATGVAYEDDPTADIYIGTTQHGARPAGIEVDDIMIFDRILPAGEIKANVLKNKRN